MIKEYCTQNDSDCQTCSLVNYGRDCHNVEIAEGESVGMQLIDFKINPDDKAKFVGELTDLCRKHAGEDFWFRYQ